MLPTGIQVVLALLLVMPNRIMALLVPRQTAFSNDTSTPTSTSGQATAIPTPPPCCWIVVGDFAVGYASWYSSTAEKVVATVVTTYSRGHNGTTVAIGSTTIPRPSSEYPEPGIWHHVGAAGPKIPGVPTDLLTGAYGGASDYAGTYVGTDTVMTFPNTDLVIAQPTPYDYWMRIGIYTETPDPSINSAGDLSIWPASVCGTYSTSTEYSYTTWTQGTVSAQSAYTSSSLVGIYTHLQPSDPGNRLRFFIGDPDPGYYDTNYTDRLNTLNATYIQAKTSQFTEERVNVALPTNIVDWLATQEEVIKEYPYIKKCWLGPKGVGQPTVHVPVMALTVTSSVFLDEAETPTAESSKRKSTLTRSRTSTVHTIVTVRSSSASSAVLPTATAEILVASSDTNPPGNTGDSDFENESSTSDPIDTSLASATQSGTTESKIEEASPTFESALGETKAPKATNSDSTEHTESSVSPATTTKLQSTAASSVEAIGGLASAIRSVVAQQGEASPDSHGSSSSLQATHVRPATVTLTTASDEQPIEAVTGFAIGAQTASPGGEAVTRGGSVFSALASGSGLEVIADGQTSTITAASVPGTAVAQISGSDDEYLVGGNTLTAGGIDITGNGKTMTALPAGSGVRVAGSGQTTLISGVAFADSTSLQESSKIDLATGSELDSPTPAVLPLGSQQLVKISGNVYTASAINGPFSVASDETINSTLTIPGASTASLNTTDMMQGETSSSTHGLGDAIVSGIGGGASDGGGVETATSSRSTGAEAISTAAHRSIYIPFGSLFTLPVAFALL